MPSAANSTRGLDSTAWRAWCNCLAFKPMGAVCSGRVCGDAERTSPNMTSGWMPTYGSGKGDEPMMSGKLYKRSSLHGTFQPRHFELLLNKQTGEVSNTGHWPPSISDVVRASAARSQVVLQYRSMREKTVKHIQWSQVRAVNRCRPSVEFEFTISLRLGVDDGAVAMPDVILRAADGLALEAWLAGSGAPAAHTQTLVAQPAPPARVRCEPTRACMCVYGRPAADSTTVVRSVARGAHGGFWWRQ